MATDAWTIPFDGVNYVCWKDRNNVRQHRKLTEQEERDYFSSSDKDKYLNDLLDK